MASNQVHITADIGIAVESYYRATGDSEWMELEGCELIRDIARFLASRLEFNRTINQYEIKGNSCCKGGRSIERHEIFPGVMGPDEDHEKVDNNFYTNVAFRRVLQFAV